MMGLVRVNTPKISFNSGLGIIGNFPRVVFFWGVGFFVDKIWCEEGLMVKLGSNIHFYYYTCTIVDVVLKMMKLLLPGDSK